MLSGGLTPRCGERGPGPVGIRPAEVVTPSGLSCDPTPGGRGDHIDRSLPPLTKLSVGWWTRAAGPLPSLTVVDGQRTCYDPW